MERLVRNDKRYELREVISELIENGYKQSDVARHCGLSRQRISAIIKDIDKEAKHETD